MLRKFKIAIDGQEYLVEMEEIGGVPQPVQPVAAAAPAAPVQAAPVEAAPEVAKSAPSEAGADAMTAPMPGAILRTLVNIGDIVEENQPLMILEAMKMENEIVAGKPGKVTGIFVDKGDVVNPGDPLIAIG